MRKFHPIVRNAHLLTVAGNFWQREIDLHRFPAQTQTYCADGRNTVVVYEHRPVQEPRGHIVFLHGLEGSADAGYIKSFAQSALERGFAVHRKNLRTCGGTENLSETMYHSGLTSDVRHIISVLTKPVFVVGFSLGGNVALKLAGELRETDSLAGVCAVSTPIDLARSVAALDKPQNMIYRRRFLARLCERVARKSKITPGLYDKDRLASVRSIYEFDDAFTAPLFGFGTAANYYATQSAVRFLDAIRTPTLLIAAKDDPLVPFSMYEDCAAIHTNPHIQLIAPEHGGHLGFISKSRPRFWLDGIALDWIESVLVREAVAQ